MNIEVTIPKRDRIPNPIITRGVVDICQVKSPVNPYWSNFFGKYEVRLHSSASSRHCKYKLKVLFQGTFIDCLKFCYKNGMKVWGF